MDLFKFLDHGIKKTGGTQAEQATEKTRKQWIDTLLVDETRAWLSIDQKDRKVITGLLVLLTLSGLAQAYDTKNADTPNIRVIRGAISALEGCVNKGDVISVDDARAISAACSMAREAVEKASIQAIQHACLHMDKVTA